MSWRCLWKWRRSFRVPRIVLQVWKVSFWGFRFLGCHVPFFGGLNISLLIEPPLLLSNNSNFDTGSYVYTYIYIYIEGYSLYSLCRWIYTPTLRLGLRIQEGFRLQGWRFLGLDTSKLQL